MDDQLIILGCSFGGAALLTLFIFQLLRSRGTDGKLRNRLSGKSAEMRRAVLRMDLGQPDGVNVAEELARDRASER